MESVDQKEFVKQHPFEPMPGEKGMNLEQLIEAGLVKPEEVTTQGAYLALLGLMKALKARRNVMGLSLTGVSERSGLTRPVISALENGKAANPTLETLYRYARALDATIGLVVEELEAEECTESLEAEECTESMDVQYPIPITMLIPKPPGNRTTPDRQGS